MGSLNIAVLESRWDESTNFAVKPVFDLMSHLIFRDYDSYYYERFVSGRSFEDAVVAAIANRSVRYLYIATHGSKEGLICPNGDRIGRARLRKFLREALGGRKTPVRGLYFAACDFTSEANAHFILEAGAEEKRPISWVCGYESDADWMESAVLDALFFYLFYYARDHHNTSERRVIQAVADDLRRLAPGLVAELKFGVYIRGGPDSIHNIVR